MTRLWRILVDRPGAYTAADLAREVGASKAGLRRALLELEDLNLIHLEERNDD